MAINLTSGAIRKIVSGKCDFQPLVQVIGVKKNGPLILTINNKQWCVVELSDGSFWQYGCIPLDIYISNKLRKGSILQLTKFQFTSGIYIFNLNVVRSKCGIIGDSKLLSLVERSIATIPDEDHVDSHLNEDIDDNVEGPPTSKQKHSASTQRCSFHSTQNKKRKRQYNNDNITSVAKDISKIARMMMEKEDKMMRMMIEKNNEDDMGACFEKLKNIGWGSEDPLYDTALLLFGESVDYRKVWLHLKPESCGKWVKNAGSKFGLLD